MNFISVEELSKTYGNKILFDKITFGINKGQKIGLVAKNGAGKTTLLNILIGKDTPDKGLVSRRKEITLTFLDQNPDFDPEAKVFETVYHADSPLLAAVVEYELALEAYEENQSEQNILRFHHATENMDKFNAWDYESKIKEILSRLSINFMDKKIGMLSGGQKKRLALASVLIHQPDVLILDEPTNHLDVEMIEWLEAYLQNKDITLLLVTHDRYFLDEICNEIIELDRGTIFTYKGNFGYYLEKKAEREQVEASELDKAKNLYRRELEWARRMPKARTTKSKSRMDAFEEVREKALKRHKDEKLSLNVKAGRLGGKILELIKLNKSYGDQKILNSFSYIFKKGDKIGVVGKNGIGKSTFLNMVLGLEKIDGGKISTGETVKFGYYSQQGMIMGEDKRLIDVVKDIAEFIPLADGTMLPASQLLTKFLFPPEVQYSMVSKLSGGEKRRLYLLTILIENPNFLILDEPTNDLDLVTLSVLEDFLDSFQGCLLIVSHDRYFMDRLVNHLFVFEGDGEVSDFTGNYSEYRIIKDYEDEQKRLDLKAEKIAEKENIKQGKTKQIVKKLSFKEQQELDTLTIEIEELETEKKEIIEILSDANADSELVIEKGIRLKEVDEDLDAKTFRWLELGEV